MILLANFKINLKINYSLEVLKRWLHSTGNKLFVFSFCNHSALLKAKKHGIYLLVRSVDVSTRLRTSEYNLSAGEDKQDNFWTFHFVDKSWKEFRLVVASRKLFMFFLQ